MKTLYVRIILITFIFACLFSLPITYAAPAGDNIIISEVEYDPSGAESEAEWFELFNPTGATINIGNWTVEEISGQAYTFPDPTNIAAGAYLLVVNDTAAFNTEHAAIPDLDMSGPDCFSATECLRLNNSGTDSLTLRDGPVLTGTTVDFVNWEVGGTFARANNGESICRSSSIDTDTGSDWLNNCSPTPGTGNLTVIEIKLDYLGSNSYNISSAVIDDQFDISTESVVSQEITFNNDGSKMYILDSTNDEIYSYPLATSYDVSTGGAATTLDISAEATDATGLLFNREGTKMYVSDTSTKHIFEYNLSVAFDISTAINTGSDLNIGPQESIPQSIKFNNDGTKLFLLGTGGLDITEYDLATAYDVSTATDTGSNFSIVAQDNAPQGLAFDKDGDRLYMLGSNTDRLYEYSLSTAFDVSTAVFVDSLDVSAQENAPQGVAFNDNGTKLYIVGSNGDDVNEYLISQGSYKELPIDDGSIDISKPLKIKLRNDTFQDTDADNILDIGTEVTIGNVPAGLTPHLTLSSGDTVATLTFTGRALSHLNLNDVTDLTFIFSNSAFTKGDASLVVNSGDSGAFSSNVGIDFNGTAPTDIKLDGGDNESIDENRPVGTAFSKISSIDLDANDFHSYSLVAGAGDTDNASFKINGNNLITNTALDFETKNSYSIRIQSNDGRGGIYSESFTITVIDLPTEVDSSGVKVWDLNNSANYTVSDATKAQTSKGIAELKLKGTPIHEGVLADNLVTALAGSRSVKVIGNFAYITGFDDNGVEVVDISNPAAPVHHGVLFDDAATLLVGPYELEVVGDYAYVVSASDHSLEIIDISNPAVPVHVGKLLDTPATALDEPYDIKVIGDYAYIAARVDDGIEIVDISNPAAPVHVSAIFDNPARALNGPMSIDVVGDYAYISAFDENGVEIIDISNPAAPVHVAAIFDTPATALVNPREIKVVGNYAYIAGFGDDGIEILDISNPAAPTHVGVIFDDANSRLNGPINFDIEGDFAYITSLNDNAVEVVDISNPNDPIHIGSIVDNGDLL